MSAMENKAFENDSNEEVPVGVVEKKRSFEVSIPCKVVGGGENEKKLEAESVNIDDKDRKGWGNKIEFILAVVGFAVGLGNIWRFPYLCQKHGGGAFILPYILCLFVLAIPIFYLELALGQRFRRGPLHLWNKLCKPLAGVGIAAIICAWFISIYLEMIVAWCFYYLFISFSKELPYATCPCVTPVCNATNPEYLPECVRASPTTYYWYQVALGSSGSIDVSGQFNWKLMMCLMLGWLILYFIIWKGVSTMGKVAYFTAIFPYVVLFIFFIRSMTLEGAGDGILHMIKPQYEKLMHAETWLAAFTQVFYSLGLAMGSVISLASYNDIHNNVQRDAFLISSINAGTSMFAGVTIFGILGYKANNKYQDCLATGNLTCDKNAFLNDVAQGPGLTFIAFTEAMSTMKYPQLWSVLFFVMILVLGIGSMIGQFEPVRTTVSDLKLLPYKDEVTSLIMVIISFLIGLVFCQGSGEYWLQIFDSYSATYGLLAVGFSEIVCALYVYGFDKLKNDIKFMLGKPPNLYWSISWRFTAPILTIGIFIVSVYELFSNGISYQAFDLKLGKSVPLQYPAWAFVVCVFFILSSIIAIPLTIVLVKMGLFRFSAERKARNEARFRSKLNVTPADIEEDDIAGNKLPTVATKI